MLIASSCQNKISTRFSHFNEGYQDFKLDFLEEKPEVEILCLETGIGQRCRLGVVYDNNFNRILLSFISENQLNSYPGDFIFLIDGMLNEKNEIRYNDVKAITTSHHINDTLNQYRLFLKDNKTGNFIEYLEEDNENDVFTGLNNKFKMPALKDSLYSSLIVSNMTNRTLKNNPSPKNCVQHGSRNIKMDFEYIPDLMGLNVLCYNADSVQKCIMNLAHKYYKKGLNNLFPNNQFDVYPCNYIIFLSGLVEDKEMIKTEEIKALSTITLKDRHFYHSFFLKNELNDFEDVPEMSWIGDSINIDNYELIAKHLIPKLSNSKCSFIFIRDFEAISSMPSNPINQFREKFKLYLR